MSSALIELPDMLFNDDHYRFYPVWGVFQGKAYCKYESNNHIAIIETEADTIDEASRKMAIIVNGDKYKEMARYWDNIEKTYKKREIT